MKKGGGEGFFLIGKEKKGEKMEKRGEEGLLMGENQKKDPNIFDCGEGRGGGRQEEEERRRGKGGEGGKEVENGDGYRSWGGRWRKKGGLEVERL